MVLYMSLVLWVLSISEPIGCVSLNVRVLFSLAYVCVCESFSLASYRVSVLSLCICALELSSFLFSLYVF